MMKTLCYIIIGMWAFAAAACDGDVHEGEFAPPEGEGVLAVGTQTDEAVAELNATTLLLFDEGERLCLRETYANPKQLSLQRYTLPEGYYTAVVVVNVDGGSLASHTQVGAAGTLFSEFIEWIGAAGNEWADMLTGNAAVAVGSCPARVTVMLRKGAEGIRLPVLRVQLSLPEPTLPDYVPAALRAARSGVELRCVAEVCKAGTDEVILRKRSVPDGYAFDLRLNAGVYDLRLWTDYAPAGWTGDCYYLTDAGLQGVKLNREPYRADTDAKDAAYAFVQGVKLTDEGGTLSVAPERPLAKYRLVATDVERYRKMVADNGYPPLEELVIRVVYEGFFPSGFNVTTGKPNDAATGVAYALPMPAVEAADTEAAMGADWVLVNGTESFVDVRVETTDGNGKVVARADGIRIHYKRGYLTTVRGDFLTAGTSGGGIDIDTEWDGEYEVEF